VTPRLPQPTGVGRSGGRSEGRSVGRSGGRSGPAHRQRGEDAARSGIRDVSGAPDKVEKVLRRPRRIANGAACARRRPVRWFFANRWSPKGRQTSPLEQF
jgi:hypothetical protein